MTNLFTRIPHELQDASWSDEITDSMYLVMEWLHRCADWETGRVKFVTAETIHHQTRKRFAIRTLRDAMANLEDCGWITRHMKPGQHGWFWVTIHNYSAVTSAGTIEVLNPKTITVYRNAEPNECRHQCPEGGQHDGQHGAAIRETTEPTEPLEPQQQAAAENSQCPEEPEERENLKQPNQDINSGTSLPSLGGDDCPSPVRSALGKSYTVGDDVAIVAKASKDMNLDELIRCIEIHKHLIAIARQEISETKKRKDESSKARLTVLRADVQFSLSKIAKVEARRKEENARLRGETRAAKERGKVACDRERESRQPKPSPAAEELMRTFCSTHSTEYYPADACLLEPMAVKYDIEECRRAFQFMVGHKFWGDKSPAFLARSSDGRPWFVKLMEQYKRSKKTVGIDLLENKMTPRIHEIQGEEAI